MTESRPGVQETPWPVSVVGTINLVLRHARTVVALPVLAAGFALIFHVVRGPTYVAYAMFKPQAPRADVSQFAGLAAQFGVNIGRISEGESVDFYARLLKSREVLRDVALTRYTFPTDATELDSVSGTLLELYEARGETENDRIQATIERLDDDIDVRTDLSAGIVTVTTRAPWADLAVDINRRVLDLLNEFNLEKRQTQATAERRFVESRLADAGAQLEEAEGALARFMEQNRRYQNSPELSTEASRLQRRVDLRLQVYTSLAQAYEQARVEEVRNTPVVTILDNPEGSQRRVGGLLGTTFLGFLLGLVLAAGLILAREYAARERVRHPEEFARLRNLGRDLGRRASSSDDAVADAGTFDAAADRIGGGARGRPAPERSHTSAATTE